MSSVDKVMELAMEQEALEAYVLPVATAYHSRLLSPCTARLLSEIKANAIRDPRIPILSYATLEAVPDGETLKKVMAHQLSHPVWWVDVVRKLKNGNRLFLEVGPGAMLSRTVRWIDRHIKMMNTGTVDAFLKAIEHMKRSG
jgi:[acyl-carrier-protein] S-malonyltransferase